MQKDGKLSQLKFILLSVIKFMNMRTVLMLLAPLSAGMCPSLVVMGNSPKKKTI